MIETGVTLEQLRAYLNEGKPELRDQFAMYALVGLLTASKSNPFSADHTDLVDAAWAIADSMVARREKA